MPGPTTLSINPSTVMSSDANFRTWGSAISAALTTAGLVQTADTGQINWTTVTRPGGATTAAGYEIWKFNDALQSTCPIFMKIEYGTAGVTTLPLIWVSTATGSDGAGGLASSGGFGTTVTNRNTIASASASDNAYTSALWPIYVNGDGSSLIIGHFPGSTSNNYGGALLIERTRSWDGTVNSDGFLTAWTFAAGVGGTVSKGKMTYFSTVVTQPAETTWWPSFMPNTGGVTAVVGSTLYPYPIFPTYGGKMDGPCTMMMVIPRADLAVNSQVSITRYGTSHTYAALTTVTVAAGMVSVGAVSATSGYGLLARID